MKNDEAIKVFEAYLTTGHVPHPYELREASKAAITVLSSYEQMMKDAVEGEVENASFGIVYLRKNLTNDGYSTGEKVRIIIVKEDEQ